MSKLVYDKEWVRIQNMLNKKWKPHDPRCELCEYLTAGVVWFNIHRKTVRCTKCFTPEEYKPFLLSKKSIRL